MWGKRKTEIEEISNPARVNDRALLDYRGRRYLTRVEDVRNGEVHVGAPMDRGKVIKASADELVMMNVLLDSGLQRYSAKVLRMDLTTIPLVVLGGFRDLGLLQRRRYDRLEERLKVRYRPEPVTKLMEGLWSDAIVLDISAGGLKMSVPVKSDIKVGDKIDVDIQVPGSKIVNASCKVTRVSPPAAGTPDRKCVGLTYLRIGAADRDMIHRYIRKKYVEMEEERRRMSRIRLTENLPIQYTAAQRPLGGYGNGRICEMSIGGLRFTSTDVHGLEIGGTIDVEFPLGDQHRVQSCGEIVHMSALNAQEGDSYLVGIRFSELDGTAANAISSFLGMTGYRQSTLSKSA
jgi:c-di-GMP-binding flagellar brake protein YcgR